MTKKKDKIQIKWSWRRLLISSWIKIIFFVIGIILGFYIFEGIYLKFWIILMFLLLTLDFSFTPIKNYLIKKFKIKPPRYLETLIGIFLVVILVFIASYITLITDESTNKTQKLEKIVEDYHEIHKYSSVNLFVGVDSSIDVWNLVKTSGINAQICAGNINEEISSEDNYQEYLIKMDHAWVMAEVNPFEWVALETTGGYLVFGESIEGTNIIKNSLYYYGTCFDNPKEFKKFINLRDDYFEVCGEADKLIEEWNTNYVGKIRTFESAEFDGRVQAKKEECNSIVDQLDGLLT